MVIFLKNVFPPYLWGFLADNQKNVKGVKIRKDDEETEYFEKKTFSSKKASLPKWEGAKYAVGSRPCCSQWVHHQVY